MAEFGRKCPLVPGYSAGRMDSEETRRRLKAARALAGLSVPALATRIDRSNELGERTLRKIESGERPLRPMELRVYLEACGLPYEFLTANLADLGHSDPGLEERLAVIESMLERILGLAQDLAQRRVASAQLAEDFEAFLRNREQRDREAADSTSAADR
jgi:transcriptional regulator with XRE-family HTH domain